MYRYTENQLIFPEDFFLPFSGTLNKENRWVRLAQLIPWPRIEKKYARVFRNATPKGAKPYSAHLAFGALIIQQCQKLTDRETVEQIAENPYMQYFLGLEAFQQRPPFHPSMMSRFRKRLRVTDIQKINDWIIGEEQAALEKEKEHDPNDPKPPVSPSGKTEETAQATDSLENKGQLLLDATCAPADIAYPTDISSLLNQCREKLEAIIGCLYASVRQRVPMETQNLS